MHVCHVSSGPSCYSSTRTANGGFNATTPRIVIPKVHRGTGVPSAQQSMHSHGFRRRWWCRPQDVDVVMRANKGWRCTVLALRNPYLSPHPYFLILASGIIQSARGKQWKAHSLPPQSTRRQSRRAQHKLRHTHTNTHVRDRGHDSMGLGASASNLWRDERAIQGNHHPAAVYGVVVLDYPAPPISVPYKQQRRRTPAVPKVNACGYLTR